MNETVENLIDQYLAKEQEISTLRQRSGKWPPSGFGSCFRKQFFSRQNIPQTNPPDKRTLRVFKAGKLFENFIAECLNGQGNRSIKIDNEHISGEADFVLSENSVTEIKSQHSKAFHYMRSTGYDITKERRGNILQVMTYVMLLGKKIGRLVYVSKDDLCVAEYEFHIDKWKLPVEEEIRRLNEFWENETLPPPHPRAFGVDKQGNPNECVKYCVFRDHCFRLQRKEC